MLVLKDIKLITFLFFLHYVVFTVQAQHENPKNLKFVLKANHDVYKTNDVVCLEDQFTDSHGKMWFSTCLNFSYADAGLVSFDGFNFIMPKLNLSKLKGAKKQYIGLLGNKIFGYSTVDETAYLFYFDVDSYQVRIYDSLTIENASSKDTSVLINPDRIDVVRQEILDDKIYTYVHINSKVNLIIYDNILNKESYNGIELPTSKSTEFSRTTNFHKEWFYGFNHNSGEIVKVNLINGKTYNYPLNFELNDYLKEQSFINVYSKHLVLNYHKHNWGFTKLIFDFNDNNITKLVDSIPSYSREHFTFFSNTKGQYIIQHYSKKLKDFVLYIKDTDGKVYDVSSILNDLNDMKIKRIYGEDFTKRLNVLTERGLFIYKKKESSFIAQNIETKGPVRGIEHFDNYLVYLKETGINQEKLYSLKNQTHDKKVLCDFNWLKLEKTHNKIWGIADKNLAYYDLKTGQCNFFKTQQEPYLFTISHDGKQIVFADYENKFWLFDLNTNDLSPVLYNGKSLQIGNQYADFLMDTNGLLWIATVSGLFKYSFETESLTHLNEVINGFDFGFTSLAQGENNDLWLGSYTSGLLILDKESLNFKIIEKKNGLANNTVASITRGLNQLYWVATYNGVSVLDSKAKVLDNLNEEDGLIHKESNRHAATLLDNGQIAIGTIDGISIIDPGIFLSTYHKKDDFRIFFTQINYSAKNKDSITTITNGFNTINNITLPPTDRNIKLEFASSNYIAPDKISYAYKIDKYKDEWIVLGKSNQLSLFSLSAGDYELKIKALNEQGKESQNMLSLNLKVEDFFYNSIEFYIILLFLIFIASLSIIFFLKNRIRIVTARMTSDNQRLEQLTQELKDLNRAKNDFFTHITHEFRTPLTVIKGVTQHLRRSSNHNYDKEIETLEHHSEDLLEMVKQILDLRKLSSNKLQLHLEQSDLVLHLKYFVDNLQFPALQKGITLKVIAHSNGIMMDLDTEKLKSVINNIILNAIKHTPEGGTISVQLTHDKQNSTVTIDIIDNGEGISNKELQKVFELFYQTENELFIKTKGSGIGLYYAKELIDLMKGKIVIKNNKKQGTTVSIKLPITTNAERFGEEIPSILTETNTRKKVSNSDKKDAYSILIIEDNPAVRSLLEMQLSVYNLSFAHDGDQGIQKASKIIPDIIISDIMMPGKDGYQVCSILKQDQRTSHIPIILLTARVDKPSKLKGLEVEADGYIKKPYDINELHLKINNLINNRLRLQKIYQHFDKNAALTKQPKEDEFILKLRNVILNNIKKENFSVQDVCETLKISRSGMHRKIKALTGLSAANYINKIRMQQAKTFIETKDANISEIAYMVGLTNLSYFSTLYKEEFGMSPKAYKETLA